MTALISGDPKAVAGSRGRAACARLDEATAELATALRRAVPFIARRRITISAGAPRCTTFEALTADTTIAHTVAFTVGPPPTHGAISFDDVAMARILDGLLGGEGNPPEAPRALSAAQMALATRMSGAVVRAFGEVLARRLGIDVQPAVVKEASSGTAAVATLELDGGGKIAVALPLSVLAVNESEVSDEVNMSLANAMAEVELDVVAELGNLRLSLETLANLQVGDVLRLVLPLDERARVCAGGATLFRGRPTTKGEVVAIALERKAA